MANSAIGANRLDQYGNAATPRAQQSDISTPVPQPGGSADSPIKVEGPPEPVPIRIPRTRVRYDDRMLHLEIIYTKSLVRTGYHVLYDDIKIN
jgi:hypothetical protein